MYAFAYVQSDYLALAMMKAFILLIFIVFFLIISFMLSVEFCIV